VKAGNAGSPVRAISSNGAVCPGARRELAVLTEVKLVATVVPALSKKVNTGWTDAAVVVLLLRTVPTMWVSPRTSTNCLVTVAVKEWFGVTEEGSAPGWYIRYTSPSGGGLKTYSKGDFSPGFRSWTVATVWP
jgi:hypothetical protein